MTLQSGFTFQIWDEMRAHAQRVAMGSAAPPTLAQCTAWLQDAAVRHRIELPQNVVDFYAAELCSMIADLRARVE